MAEPPPPGLPDREPIFPPDVVALETDAIALADLVRLLAESIIDAQVAMDRASADILERLAHTYVEIVPEIKETIDRRGHVSYHQAPKRRVSLLELGMLPTFYQFSETRIEVALDVKIVEHLVDGTKRLGLQADTRSIRLERKLNRNVDLSSRIVATIVPVPRPIGIDPERVVKTDDGEAGA